MADPKQSIVSTNSIKSKTAGFNDKLVYDTVTSFSDPTPRFSESTPKDRDVNSQISNSDEEGLALAKNPFLDPEVAEYWAMAYEKSQYECRAAFDPAFNWTDEEEKQLIKKLDWRVCLWAVSLSRVIMLVEPG